MNKQPILYLQTDPRWAKQDYSAKGETTDIRESGCGPTCAAMLIETMTGKTFTPKDACAWSLKHGYKAPRQGTYYSYFTPQFAAFGIDCQMLNWAKTYGKPEHPNHQQVVEKLKEGYYAIALMGKGLWTKSGHFVVLWWQDGKVRINDPASTKAERTSGNIQTFRAQAVYYWLVDARSYNKGGDDMTKEEVQAMVDQAVKEELAARDAAQAKANEQLSPWAKDAWDRAVAAGTFDGTRPGAPLTREQAAVLAERLRGDQLK